MLRIGQESTMAAHVFTFSSQLLQHGAHVGVGETMRRPSMYIVTVGIDGEYEYRYVRHGTHVDELLNGVADVPFVGEEIAYALNDIARCVNDDSGRKHFQRFAISLRSVGFRCPRPMKKRFKGEQM